MPENRPQIPVPLGGISRDMARADQPMGTSEELTNVRSVDPLTGRVRLSQRAGSSKLVEEQVTSGKIDEVVSVAYDVPRVTYERITASHPFEWTVVEEGADEVVDITTDRQGNTYALTLDGSVEKRNSKGELVDTIKFPGKGGGTAVRRIVVDELDSVYIASNLDVTDADKSQCSLFKFRLTERGDGKDIYEQQWELSLESNTAQDTVVDFAVRNGLIAAVITQKSDGAYKLKGYIGAFGGFPLALYEQDAPSGTTRITLSEKGDIFLVAPEDGSRWLSSSEDGYGSGIVSWTPHSEFEATTRLHSWFDAESVTPGEDGAVEVVPDRRFLATTAENPLSDTNTLTTGQPGGYEPGHTMAEEPPTDIQPNRSLGKAPHTSPVASGDFLPPPTKGYATGASFRCLDFDQNALSEAGGVYTGQVLLGHHSAYLSKDFFKSDTSGDGYPDSDGSFVSVSFAPDKSWAPGVDQGYRDFANGGWFDGDTRGDGFTMCFAVELPDTSTGAQVIASSAKQAADNSCQRWALLYNHPSPGDLTLRIQGTLYSSTLDSGVTDHTIAESAWRDTAGGKNARRFVVLTYVHGGTADKNHDGSPENQNESTFRVNGRHAARFSGTTMAQEGSIRFGHPTFASGGVPALQDPDFVPPGSFSGFDGKIFEGLCLYHPDDTAANNLNTVGVSFGTGWGSVQPYDTSTGDPPAVAWNEAGPVLTSMHSGSLDRTGYTGDIDALASYTNSATTVERIEGYLAHRYGSGDVLPELDPATTDTPTNGLYYSHPFAGNRVPIGLKDGYLGLERDPLAPLSSVRPILAKYSGSNGDAIWALNGGGIGYGVVTDNFGFPVTYGKSESTDSTVARRVLDNGSSYDDNEAEGAWRLKSSSDPVDSKAILFSDAEGDIYWPGPTLAEWGTVRKLARDTGETVVDVAMQKSSQRALCVAGSSVPYPLYLDDDLKGPEFLYIGGTQGKPANGPTLSKLRLMSQTQAVADGASLRRHDLVVVGGGDIKQVKDGVVTTAEAAAFESGSPYIQGVQLFGEVFLTDGEKVKVLNPRTGVVTDYKPTDGGEIPERCRILTAWRGRLIFARSADNPYEITATELGNPYGANIYPATPSVTQAWRGTAAGVGRAPDIVNAFIPMSDDYAIIGGDHSLFLMRGDPAAGGEVDTITDQVGAAYGNAWTKGPTGECYIFTSRGGVVVVPPGGGGVQRLSASRIERTLQDLDLTRYMVRMVWDYRREGLIVCPVPIGDTGVLHKGWFFEAKTGGWYEDEWSSWEVQPTALTTFDGDDPDDRRVVLGCEDGYLRYIDEQAANDDGHRIVSKALIGPLVPSGEGYSYKFSRPQIVLASDQGPCDYELLASDAADRPGRAWSAGQTFPGRGPFLPARTRGSAVWVRLQNGRLDERWSLEDMTVAVAPAGRSRTR